MTLLKIAWNYSDNDQEVYEQLKQDKTDDDSSYVNLAYEKDQEKTPCRWLGTSSDNDQNSYE